MYFNCVGNGGGGRGRLLIHRKYKDCTHLHGFGGGVGGHGGPRIIENPWISMHFIVWAMGWGQLSFNRAAGHRIIRNAKDSNHGCGSVRERSGWLRNHKKCMECHAFAWFWKWAGGGRLGSESCEMHRTVIIFMSLEVEGRGASGLRIIRNA